MKRFDVCAASRFVGSGKDRLVVVLQHESLDELTTTVVAPLYKPAEFRALQRLTPTVIIGRQKYIVAIDRLASVPKRQLGRVVGNLEDLRFELIKATDYLFSGI
jgi:toxin CcdB